MHRISIAIDRLVTDQPMSRRQKAELGESVAAELTRLLDGRADHTGPQRQALASLPAEIAAAIRAELPTSLAPAPQGKRSSQPATSRLRRRQ